MKPGLTPKVVVAALSSPLEIGADRAPKVAEAFAALLHNAGCETVQLGAIGTPEQASAAGRQATEAHADAAVFIPTSWFEDYLVLDFLEECPAPVFFWPLPGIETGALCGTQQVTCYLKQLGSPFGMVFGAQEDPRALEGALAFLRAAALKGRLRRARIGLAGSRVSGMTHTSPNEFMLKKIVGPRVSPIDLAELIERAAKFPKDHARALWATVLRSAGRSEVAEPEAMDSMGFYLALKELVAERGLDALAVGCYPRLMGRVCLAASLLADEGIPLACEGDVHGAVGQLMLSLLTGGPTHNTDWLEPLPDGSIVFTHCGSGSFLLAEKSADIRLASVRLTDQGVCALFPAKPGPVTLVSLLALPAGYQCALLEGEALRTEMVFPGNPLRVRFGPSAQALIEWVAAEGIGHHWMAGYGHVGREVRAWAGMAGEGLRLVEP